LITYNCGDCERDRTYNDYTPCAAVKVVDEIQSICDSHYPENSNKGIQYLIISGLSKPSKLNEHKSNEESRYGLNK